MKIICIGRNYLAHVKELDNALPTEPMFFMKPETALLHGGEPFPYPDFSKEVHYETELVLRICKTGKAIDVKQASEYYDAITVGIDFDYSAPIGKFKKISELKCADDIAFGMKLNGEWVQQGHSRDMIFSFDRIIAHVSRFVTLNEDDIVFTGTPQGVGEVHVGDRLELFLEGESVFGFRVK